MKKEEQNCLVQAPAFTEMERVYLAIPCGADACISIGTVRTILHAIAEPRLSIAVMPLASSALVCNFNHLLCDLRHKMLEGHAFDWFVMLHSDIECEQNWLSKLVGIAKQTSADILSVLSPIKDERGLVSAGLDTNQWMPRRFTMTEVHGSMPKTFDSEYCRNRYGHDLIVNTACMIFNTRRPWIADFWFETKNEIALDGRGKATVLFEPEDWKMSRWANRNNLKLFTTSEVKLCHLGGVGYMNDHVWGQQQVDEGNITNSALFANGAFKRRNPSIYPD